MTRRTLHRWISEKPLWNVAGANYAVPLLSFRDVAQVYYVEIIRSYFHLSMKKAREVLALARKESRAEYPLLNRNIRLFFRHIILTKPARGNQPRRDIDLSQHRQLGISTVIDMFATRIQRDKKGEGARLYPWRYWQPGIDEATPVTIDPEVMSGRLVVTGTRIPVQVIWSRKASGESVPRLANDYGLTQKAINLAISHVEPPRDSVQTA